MTLTTSIGGTAVPAPAWAPGRAPAAAAAAGAAAGAAASAAPLEGDDTIVRRMNEGRSHHDRIGAAIRFMVEHWRERPRLESLAAAAGLSKFHFDRVFRRWAGISPLRFAHLVALTHGKRLLAEGRSILDASIDLGLSGPARLHDMFVSLDAVTPGDFKSRGRGLEIAYGIHETPFGPCLVGLSPRGVCWLSFVEKGREEEGIAALRACWPEADLAADERRTRGVARSVFDRPPSKGRAPLRLHVQGTNFQTKVWKALLSLPPGRVATYGEVARAIGRPGAARAVGSAVAVNPVAVLIPCHRVIRETGVVGEYRWGSDRKRALLAWEAASVERRVGA